MTDSVSNQSPQADWGRIALSVVLAATVIRVLVVTASQVPLFFDEAQYWVWAQDLAFGYYSKPPFIAWAIAATTSVCGDSAGCVRISAPVFHGATAILLFFVGRQLYDEITGFWATVTYLVLPGVSLSAVIVSTDVYLLFFWALSLLVYIQAERSGDGRLWLALGLTLGLGLLSKYAMVFFFVCLLVDAFWQPNSRGHWRRSGIWTAIGVAAIVYAPNALWNWQNGFPSYRHTGENMNLDGDLFNPLALIEFAGGQFGVFGPILFAAFLWLVFRAAMNPSDVTARDRRLLAFSIPVLMIILAQALLSRAHANWAAVAYVSATVFVVGELRRLDRAVWLKASVALHIAAAAVLYNFDVLVRLLDIPVAPGMDPARRMRGWDRAGEWVATIRQDFPDARLLFDDRKVMSEMLYYVRPHPFDSVMWNPNRQSNNHFELTASLDNGRGSNFLYVINHDWPGRAGDRFDSTRHVATFRSRAFTGDVLEVRAYFLEGFKGYP